MSGLTAAVSALEAGAHVTILEKAPRCGGSANLSGGHIWTFADPAHLDEVIPLGNRPLQELVVSTAQAGRDWLAGLGVEMTEPRRAHRIGLGQITNPPQLLGTLLDTFRSLGGQLRLETALDSLDVRDGAVRGAGARHVSGEVVAVPADAVVLATGGFQGNPELLARYVGSPDHLYLRANPWSTGDGFMAATAVGAAASPGMDTFYGHAMLAPPASFRALEFRDVSQYYGPLGLAVNLAGRRFTDESVGTGEEVLNQALARQAQGRGFYLVDHAIAAGEARQAGPLTRVILERARDRGGPVVTADSLGRLCQELGAFGVPPSAALATIQEYNSACRGGPERLRHLSPPRSGAATPLVAPPFVAVAVKAAITFTTGGLALDDRMRVLSRSASSSAIAQSITELSEHREVPIPGLFAAGCDVGNIHHGSYMGGLATALTTGRVAGREAAAHARRGLATAAH